VPAGSRQGNRVTASRWARILRRLGHRVELAEEFSGQDCGVLIALHARKSAASVARFAARAQSRPIVLCMTGTDLYQDLPASQDARRSVRLADRIVVLQPLGVQRLPEAERSKARVIYQSAASPRSKPAPLKSCFEVCVLGHLREVKDPFRAAESARLLPKASRIRVTHLGGALSPEMEERAMREQRENPRYRWLGEVPSDRARHILARSRAMVLSSLSEGGANVISEAVVCGTPPICSKIPGNVGLLGADYPAYFPSRDSETLERLLWRFETDPEYRGDLAHRCRHLSVRFSPEQEELSWMRLLAELA
jgi:putative glycosyltransferase (TIGR04348 family)